MKLKTEYHVLQSTICDAQNSKPTTVYLNYIEPNPKPMYQYHYATPNPSHRLFPIGRLEMPATNQYYGQR